MTTEERIPAFYAEDAEADDDSTAVLSVWQSLGLGSSTQATYSS